MTTSLAVVPATSPTTLLRNEPVQARSNARLTSLLDAAAAVVHEIGYERLTTAMVAERAGSSIGTVYRYFPDRLAVLQALCSRSMTRFASEGVELVDSADHATWIDAIDALFDYWIDAFRTEPGFRSLRFGDVLDLRPRAEVQTENSLVAVAVTSILDRRHGLSAPDLAFHVEVAIGICDALVARAFAIDGDGEERFIAEAKSAAKAYLVTIYPEAHTA